MDEVLQKVQDINHILIRKMDEICKKYDITYYCDAGFLLGGVRHKSFIPWDDDVDIAFTRKNYEKLCSVPAEEWGEDFELVPSRKLTPNGFLDFTMRLIYVKGKVPVNIYDKALSYCDQKYLYKMPLDCFVLDNAYDNKFLQKILTLRLALIYGETMGHREYIDYTEYNMVQRVIIYILSRIGRHKSLDALFRKYERVSQSVKDGTGHFYCSNAGIDWTDYIFKKEWYREVVPIPIDDEWYDGPVGYHEVLKTWYGDYMQLPPEEERVPKHILSQSEWRKREGLI